MPLDMKCLCFSEFEPGFHCLLSRVSNLSKSGFLICRVGVEMTHPMPLGQGAGGHLAWFVNDGGGPGSGSLEQGLGELPHP